MATAPARGSAGPLFRELTRQEVHHPFERIEAERCGHGRPQVGVGVDVVEHAPAVDGLEIFDAADVQVCRSCDPLRRVDGVPGNLGERMELDRRRRYRRRLIRQLARPAAVVGVADRRGAQVEPPMCDDAHRVEQLVAEKLEADDAALGIVREVLLKQEQVVGQPHAGVS